MQRRALLATTATAGIAGLAGCGLLQRDRAITEPRLKTDSPHRKSLHFRTDDGELASFGVTGSAGSELVSLRTELSHERGSTVRSIRLRVWLPESHGDVALVSPLEGDSSPPPDLHLSSPDDRPGTVIDIRNLDDLADETISTIELLVAPATDSPIGVGLAPTIELDRGGWLETAYTLSGRLDLHFPEFGTP